MNEISFMILKMVVAVCTALITTFLIPYIRTKTSKAQQEKIADAISVAVKAAEQTLQGGSHKKEEVVKYMQQWLNENNVKINTDQLDSLIECIVYEVKQDKKEE